MNLLLRDAVASDRGLIERECTRHFGGADISSRGVWFDTRTLPAFVAERDGAVVGFLCHTPMERGRECEVVALVAIEQRSGVGGALLAEAVERACRAACARVFLTTSNDNLDAMRFYQRRGWRLCAVHPGSLERARALKPHLPEAGHYGIPVRDDVEFEVRFEG